MLKRFRDYIENEPWERFLEDDYRVLTAVCWVALGFAAIWFVPTMIRVIMYGPVQ